MLTILGLPAHPLIVHMPVVLVPALLLLLLGYLAVPPLRRRIGWLVVVLSVLAPLSVWAAWYTGHQFYDVHVETIAEAGAPTDKFTTMLADHLQAGDVLIWLVTAMAPLIWLFGLLERGRRIGRGDGPARGAQGDDAPAPRNDDPAARGRVVVMVVLGALLLGLSGASGYYLFQSGHSGAKVVWGTEKQ